MAGRWTELSGLLREWWGRHTHNDSTVMQGRKAQLVGRIQQRYGAAVDAIEQQISYFEREVAGHHEH